MKRSVLAGLVSALRAKRPVVLITALESGQQALLSEDSQQPVAFADSITETAHRALVAEQNLFERSETGPVFLHTFHPPLRLVIVGAVHLAQPLTRFAELSGYEVIVIDPRRAFAERTRFPGVTVVTEWPDQALKRLGLDRRTAVVTLTHDPKLDDRALSAALVSPCFYIGSLGSRKTHAARLERLKRAGFGAQQLERIHGPVGLDIGARMPAEIALSILAQITKVRRQDKDPKQCAAHTPTTQVSSS